MISLPSKAFQLATIVDTLLQTSYPIVEHGVAFSTALVAQPIVEMCLRLPTYHLVPEQVDRGLIRDKFSDYLPGSIVKRTAKGSGGAYHRDFIVARRTEIRETLMDGLLRREGLLDSVKLEEFLASEQFEPGRRAPTLIEMLSCEFWLRGAVARSLA